MLCLPLKFGKRIRPHEPEGFIWARFGPLGYAVSVKLLDIVTAQMSLRSVEPGPALSAERGCGGILCAAGGTEFHSSLESRGWCHWHLAWWSLGCSGEVGVVVDGQ
jgi:hypothetical protein